MKSCFGEDLVAAMAEAVALAQGAAEVSRTHPIEVTTKRITSP